MEAAGAPSVGALSHFSLCCGARCVQGLQPGEVGRSQGSQLRPPGRSCCSVSPTAGPDHSLPLSVVLQAPGPLLGPTVSLGWFDGSGAQACAFWSPSRGRAPEESWATFALSARRRRGGPGGSWTVGCHPIHPQIRPCTDPWLTTCGLEASALEISLPASGSETLSQGHRCSPDGRPTVLSLWQLKQEPMGTGPGAVCLAWQWEVCTLSFLPAFWGQGSRVCVQTLAPAVGARVSWKPMFF